MVFINDFKSRPWYVSVELSTLRRYTFSLMLYSSISKKYTKTSHLPYLTDKLIKKSVWRFDKTFIKSQYCNPYTSNYERKYVFFLY